VSRSIVGASSIRVERESMGNANNRFEFI